MTVSTGPSWHVVHTHPHGEPTAVAHLRRQSFDTYLPRYLKRRRHARRVETVATPLFPRYLFVAFDGTVGRWRSIQSTVGVSRLICNGDVPAVVPDKIVEAIREREDDQGFVRLDEPPRFQEGEKIRVLDGVFSSCIGLFEGMVDEERVAVLLDLLGRRVRLILEPESVTAA